jgi:hypothetical protein
VKHDIVAKLKAQPSAFVFPQPTFRQPWESPSVNAEIDLSKALESKRPDQLAQPEFGTGDTGFREAYG